MKSSGPEIDPCGTPLAGGSEQQAVMKAPSEEEDSEDQHNVQKKSMRVSIDFCLLQKMSCSSDCDRIDCRLDEDVCGLILSLVSRT